MKYCVDSRVESYFSDSVSVDLFCVVIVCVVFRCLHILLTGFLHRVFVCILVLLISGIQTSFCASLDYALQCECYYVPVIFIRNLEQFVCMAITCIIAGILWMSTSKAA